MSWEEQREWLLTEIENDAANKRAEKGSETDIYHGRLDAMLRVGLYFAFWDNGTMRSIGNWIDNPRGRSVRDVAGLPE